MKQFEAPGRTLGKLDADAAARLIASAADVALIVDQKGIIRDVAFGSEELTSEGYEGWKGQAWIDTVAEHSRSKVEALLREARSNIAPKRRHINYPSTHGVDVPILYSAIRYGAEGRVVALGRDLRAMGAIQQRLVDAQQSMERDYWRLRQVETRYRLLFQMAAEAVLIVDASTLKVLEANPAAAALLGENERKLVGRALPDAFSEDGARATESMLAGVKAVGRADDARVSLEASGQRLMISASIFRQDNQSLYLVRLRPQNTELALTDQSSSSAHHHVVQAVEAAPDAFVLTDADGHILVANLSFIEMAQVVSEEQARGESLERWLGRPGVDLNVLLATLKQHGAVRLFATTLRGECGSSTEVEISAVSVQSGRQLCLGFTIRNVARRLSQDSRVSRVLPRSVEQLTELVGRVTLKDLVREATDMIERLCIEAALELTSDNRANAAEMLGLSRQSLYVKLHRYDLGDLSPDDPA